MNTRAKCVQGFTLIELLVALFVTAIMFAIGYGALTEVARNRLEIKNTQTSLNEYSGPLD